MERYRLSLLLVVCAIVALGAKVPVGAAGAGVETATLKKITSRLDARTGVLTIEASDPGAVRGVAARPEDVRHRAARRRGGAGVAPGAGRSAQPVRGRCGRERGGRRRRARGPRAT